MKPTFAAAIFALLTFTAPAHAALVQVGSWSENIDLNFSGGYTATGGIGGAVIGYPNVTATYFLSGGPSLYLNGTPVAFTFNPGAGLGNPSGIPVYYVSLFGCPPCVTFSYSPGQLPAHFADFFLNGFPALSGSVTDIAVTSITPNDVSAVPLPAALPLFGAALAGLGGAGWIRHREKVSHG